jgi:small-conductance mechanosensitive channel
MVMNNHIINFSTLAETEGIILPLSITIGYDVPWRDVHQLLIDAALTSPLVEMSPEPFVYQKALDDFYVNYELNIYTKEPSKTLQIYSELHEAIQDKFNEAGIEIASPHFAAIRDGNALNIPEEYLPKDYKPGNFNLGSIFKQNK